MMPLRIEEISEPPHPLSAFEKLRSAHYAFFLDSSSDTSSIGRYSITGCEPFAVFKSKRRSIAIEWRSGRREEFDGDPFPVLKDLFARFRIDAAVDRIPFGSCGAVGYFGYDLKDHLEKLPDIAKDDLGLPDCVLGFYDAAYIHDNLRRRAYLVSCGDGINRSGDLKKRLLGKPPFRRVAEGGESIANQAVSSNFSRTSYCATIDKAKEYIRRGDIYQVNLSQRFSAAIASDPFDLYCRLRKASPAPFSAYLGFEDAAVLSSSPERFLLKSGRYIETRPIKGTRPRGEDMLRDDCLARELIESRKDRAEHIMIVDLERNDLGRVCEFGSVRLNDLFRLERYANVFHLVSTVEGLLRDDVDAIDCLKATFPGGSITGAPKIRSMEIIEELEPVKRGIYTGAIGHISFDGDMDTSIVIRTIVAKGGKVYFHVGGGIVADSAAGDEYDETLHKAAGIFSAIDGTTQGTVRKVPPHAEVAA